MQTWWCYRRVGWNAHCCADIRGFSLLTILNVGSFAHPYCFIVLLLPAPDIPFCTISSTISSMSDDGMFCLQCKRLFCSQRLFSIHVRSCQRSLPVRSAVYNHLAPILQHESAAVINASSSTVNVPSADPTIGVLTNTTTSSRLETALQLNCCPLAYTLTRLS